MTGKLRFIGFMILCFFTAGCTGNRSVTMPGIGDPTEVEFEVGGETAVIGDRVRVTLNTGESLEGIYIARERTTLTIAKDPRKPGYDGEKSENQQVLLLAELQAIECYRPGNGAGIVLILGVAIAGAIYLAEELKSGFDFYGE